MSRLAVALLSPHPNRAAADPPVILWTFSADLATDELAAADITEITGLIHQSQIPD